MDTRGEVLVSLVEKHFGGRTADTDMSQEKFKKSRDKEESDVCGYLPQYNCILEHISSQLADSYNEEEANCRRC